MELFCVKPTVHMFGRFCEFRDAFALSEKDLILTETILYEAYLQDQQLPCKVLLKDMYDPAEPKEEVIDAILKEMKGWDLARIIGIGGGSVIDIAKLLCVKDAYPIKDVIERRTPLIIDKELIILPTTCGTGSEVTYGGIVTMKETGLKTAIIDPVLSSKHAVLVPELLSTLPQKIFMHCSVDALGHAMESYLSATRGNEIARAAGYRAISLILDGYAQIIQNGDVVRLQLMKQFLTASCLGGMAVNNGGAGPVHALAYPLGEVYHMSHGESIYQFLVPVLKHYEAQDDGKYLRELKELIRKYLREAGLDDTDALQGLGTMLYMVYPARKLHEVGMQESDIGPFVANVFAEKQRLLAASYTVFTPEDACRIYRERL